VHDIIRFIEPDDHILIWINSFVIGCLIDHDVDPESVEMGTVVSVLCCKAYRKYGNEPHATGAGYIQPEFLPPKAGNSFEPAGSAVHSMFYSVRAILRSEN